MAGLATSWSKFKGNARNTGRSTHIGAVFPDDGGRWGNPHNMQYYYEQTALIESSPVLSQDEQIMYLGCCTNRLRAYQLDEENPGYNHLLWDYIAPNAGVCRSAPAVDSDGKIYVGVQSVSGSGVPNRLVRVLPDGSLDWAFDIGACPPTTWQYSSPTIAPDGTIYICGSDGIVYAVNPDGTEKWRYNTGGLAIYYSSPALDDSGNVYIGAGTGNFGALFCLSPAGNKLWSYPADPLAAPINASMACETPAIGDDGTIYIADSAGKMRAIFSDGTLWWEYAASSGRGSSNVPGITPSLGADGCVVFGEPGGSGYLHCLEAEGTPRWTTVIGGAYATPLIDGEGKVYIGTLTDFFTVLDIVDGSILWRNEYTRTNLGMYGSSPGIDALGSVYVASKHSIGGAWRMEMGAAVTASATPESGLSPLAVHLEASYDHIREVETFAWLLDPTNYPDVEALQRADQVTDVTLYRPIDHILEARATDVHGNIGLFRVTIAVSHDPEFQNVERSPAWGSTRGDAANTACGAVDKAMTAEILWQRDLEEPPVG